MQSRKNFTKNLPPVATFLRKSLCWNAFSDLYEYNHVNKLLFAVVFIPLLEKRCFNIGFTSYISSHKNPHGYLCISVPLSKISQAAPFNLFAAGSNGTEPGHSVAAWGP